MFIVTQRPYRTQGEIPRRFGLAEHATDRNLDSKGQH